MLNSPVVPPLISQTTAFLQKAIPFDAPARLKFPSLLVWDNWLFEANPVPDWIVSMSD